MKTITTIVSVFFLGLLLVNIPLKAQFINSYPTGKEEITSFSFSKEAQIIALGSKSKIELLKAESFQKISNHELTSGVVALTLSNNGRYLVFSNNSADETQNLMYWDIERGNRIPIIHSHTDKVLVIAISPDGKWLATGSKDKTIKVFDTKTLNEAHTLKGHTDDVTCLKFSPDNKFLLSGSKDKTMILWDFSNNVDLFIYKGHSKKINDVAFSPDAKLIASAGDDRTIMVWNADDPQKPIHLLNDHKDAVTCIEFTPDGRFLGSGSKDKLFYIWDYNNKSTINLNFGIGVQHTDAINFMAFSDKGKLYTSSSDRTIIFWNWGFPILSIRNLRPDDANNNRKIEGTEEVKIRFSIENSGDGDALKMKFNIDEIRKVEGLSYPASFYIEEIPAKTSYDVDVWLSASSQLKNSFAVFNFSDFKIFNNLPFPLRDTSLRVETVASPQLIIDTVRFIYSDTSQVLIGKQTGKFRVDVRNTGVGIAKNVHLDVSSDKPESDLEFHSQAEFGNIAPLGTQVLYVPVKATQKAENGPAIFSFKISEASGISTAAFTQKIIIKKYEPTLIEEIKEIVEQEINVWQKKGKWEKAEDYKVRVTEKTRESQISLFTNQTLDSLVKKELNWSFATNEYDTENEIFKISIPKFDPIYLKVPLSEAPDFDIKFKQLKIGDISYTVSGNMKNFAFKHFELIDTLSLNKTYQYNITESVAFNTTMFDFNFDPINVNIATNSGTTASTGEVRKYNVGKADVDINIPEITVKNPNVFAVIIGNEDYSSRQKGLNTERNVDFAVNDAVIFNNYLLNTYGIPEENIKLYTNATAMEINRGIKWLKSLAESRKGQAELVFYFSGHGLPDEQTREGYIMPVDVTGSDIQFAIKLSYLYAELSKFPTKKVTVILDACFSGGGRTEGLVAMKGAKIKPKEEFINGNMVVLASSSGDESSGFYLEKQHGMFTYFLLKKIQETKGEVDYQSLIDYLKEKVTVQSLISNFKNQNPQLIISNDLSQPLNTLRLGSSILSNTNENNPK